MSKINKKKIINLNIKIRKNAMQFNNNNINNNNKMKTNN